MAIGRTSIWRSRDQVDHQEIRTFKKSLDLDDQILKLLKIRGISSFEAARDFFRPSLQHLHDPFLMKDMDLAAERLNLARQKNEKFLIYGDYDVDGTTAVSLMATFLEKHYSNFETYIPDRYREGYGVSQQGIDYAHEKGISLIIALDCGIKAVDLVAYARKLGIDFIICDHHRPGPELPKAYAVLDPQRPDCAYPYKGLSGCGVGFKLCQALSREWQLEPDECWDLLDLLALSIGADIVPMTGENRVLAYFGLQKINTQPSAGLKALLKQSRVEKPQLDIGDLVFILAPRINAAGRLDHGQRAVDLLRGKDLSLLPLIANEIEQRNTERKNLDRQIFSEAREQVEATIAPDAYSTVVYKADWHKGVIGIVASRLIESYYRPTIVLTKSGDTLAGSARSVEGFDLYQALEDCEDHLLQFGGHAAAAGMTLKPEKLADFKQAFENSVRRRISEEQRQMVFHYDLELKAAELTPKFYRMLQRFAPFGPDNLAPLLLCRKLKDAGSRVVGQTKTHLKLMLVDEETGLCLEGIGFNLAPKLNLVKESPALSVLFHLELNVFRGTPSLQIRALDLKNDSELA